MGSLSCRSLEDVVTTGYIPKKVLKIIIKKSPWGKKKKKKVVRRSTWPFLFFKTVCVQRRDCSVTTSCVLHLFLVASLGWLQLLVALFL